MRGNKMQDRIWTDSKKVKLEFWLMIAEFIYLI